MWPCIRFVNLATYVLGYNISDYSIENDVEDLITQCSLDKLQEIIQKLTPDLVKKLDLNPMLDHFIASGVLPESAVEEFESNSTKLTQRNLNRWFLRNVLSKGNLQVSTYIWFPIKSGLLWTVVANFHPIFDQNSVISLASGSKI